MDEWLYKLCGREELHFLCVILSNNWLILYVRTIINCKTTTPTFCPQNLLPLPAGASAALVKPTKYHYYPHNQHIYLLPECAIQQVCNAVYVRLNWTQPLCACPSRYRDPCSASLNSDDLHTTELVTSSDRKVSRKFDIDILFCFQKNYQQIIFVLKRGLSYGPWESISFFLVFFFYKFLMHTRRS